MFWRGYCPKLFVTYGKDHKMMREETNLQPFEEEARIEGEGATAEPVQFSEAQKAAIERGRKEIAEGKFISDEQANAEIEEWFERCF